MILISAYMYIELFIRGKSPEGYVRGDMSGHRKQCVAYNMLNFDRVCVIANLCDIDSVVLSLVFLLFLLLCIELHPCVVSESSSLIIMLHCFFTSTVLNCTSHFKDLRYYLHLTSIGFLCVDSVNLV